jgi:two-component system NarL family sensor kinase
MFFPFLLPQASAKAQLVLGLNKDSLKRIIASTTSDTSRVISLITLGQQYESNIPDSAVYYYKQAKELSTRINYPAGIIRFVNNYTAILNVQGKFDESLSLHRQALALSEKYGLTVYRMKALLNIGVVYQYKEDYQAAADHYLKNLSLFERIGDAQSLSLLYNNLAGLYRNLNQPEKSILYARKALSLAEHNRDLYASAMAYNNLANALKETGNMKESVVYLNKTYEIGLQIDDINMQETALINLGDMLSKTAKPETYIPVFQKALPLADSLGDIYGKALALQGISIGFFMNKEYRRAEQKVREALLFARENKQKETESELLLLMSDIQIALGNLELSARYRNGYDSVYSTLLNADLLKNVQELETKYEVEKDRSRILQQNLLLEQKSREALRQRIWLIISAAGILLMGVILFLGYRYYRQRQQLNNKEMEALQAAQETVRLKGLLEGQLQERQRISQEMHDDMGSGLTSMLFMSRTIEGQDAIAGRLRQTAEGLVQKMNEIIWTMNHEQDTLDSLVAYMRIHIAETLDSAGLDYRFTVTEPLPDIALNQEFRRNIYLVSKEAVHNIIRHAAATRVEIDIQVHHELCIRISDNGKGFAQANGGSRFGNGLKNMQRRMDQVKGTLEIVSLSGTRVTLRAPLPV